MRYEMNSICPRNRTRSTTLTGNYCNECIIKLLWVSKGLVIWNRCHHVMRWTPDDVSRLILGGGALFGV